MDGRWLQLVERSGPILFQQTRERAIGEQATFVLTARAVIGLVVRVPNALNGRAAHRTWLTEAAVHGHLRAKGGHLFGEPVSDLRPQAFRPFDERRARGVEEPGD